MVSAEFPSLVPCFSRIRAFGAALACLLVLSIAGNLHAEESSYYVAPQSIRTSFQMGYSEKSPDRNFPVKTPVGKLTNVTGGFRFDPDTMTLTGLRLIVSSGSISTPDKGFTWKLLGPEMFDVNSFEEMALEGLQPVTFVNGTATIEARLVVLGRSKPIKITAKLNAVKDSAMGFGIMGKGKLVNVSLRGVIKCDDYNMKAYDNIGRSLGDQISLLFDMQGVRE